MINMFSIYVQYNHVIMQFLFVFIIQYVAVEFKNRILYQHSKENNSNFMNVFMHLIIRFFFYCLIALHF